LTGDGSSVLSRVAEVRDDGCHRLGAPPPARIGQQKELEDSFIHGRTGGLEQVKIQSANGLGELHVQLTVRKSSEIAAHQTHAEPGRDGLCEGRISATG
jgi:hypothetical protein